MQVCRGRRQKEQKGPQTNNPTNITTILRPHTLQRNHHKLQHQRLPFCPGYPEPLSPNPTKQKPSHSALTLHAPSRYNATGHHLDRTSRKNNTMKKPNPHRQERDYLLYLARTAKKPRGRSAAPITEADYAAVYTVPVNNKAPIHGPCLIWRRGLNTGGYGQTSHNGRKVLAHRLAYEITRGSIPHNMHILHMCNRRSCIQPAHLYAGTPQENADDKKTNQNAFPGPKPHLKNSTDKWRNAPNTSALNHHIPN